MGMQLDWRFCQKCHVIFFDGYPEKGNCAAGGAHVAQGYMFALPHDIPPAPKSQAAWRYCGKCHAMFYDGYPQKGACPTDGGGHAAAGYGFVLPHDVPPTGTAQDAWRYCEKCHAMFYDGYSDKGQCDAGGGHSAQGFMFVLPHDVPASLDFTFAPIAFSAGVAAGGNSHLTLRQDGSYTFSGHFHDSGLAPYNTALAWLVKDLVDQAYAFQHTGHIAGSLTPGSRDDWHNFLIFPAWDIGFDAIAKLLRGPKYVDRSITDAFSLYAPASDGNDPVRYAQDVADSLGLPVSTTIGELDDDHLVVVQNKITEIEGAAAGDTFAYDSPDLPEELAALLS